ncbi:MAG: hypothetical protein WC662_01380 [Candidatus Paceibacterota bacterium]|jgi:hypothetical protein
MFSKIKNIIIFVVIAGVLILGYFLFFKKEPEQANLVSSFGNSTLPVTSSTVSEQNSVTSQDFLSILLNVNNIKLNDSIFGDSAFANLRDTTIVLMPDGTEGRPNPFAPIGIENEASAINTSPLIQVPNDLGSSLTSPVGIPADIEDNTTSTPGFPSNSTGTGTTTGTGQ